MRARAKTHTDLVDHRLIGDCDPTGLERHSSRYKGREIGEYIHATTRA